jgi:endoglucanase
MGVYADYACFKNEFTIFGNGKMIRSKALDDRIGCAAMVDMIISGVKYDSYFVFSVGEEIGGVGAVAATREINPDVCIVFESTTASDLPCNEGADKVCIPGNGPVCAFMDGGTVYDKKLYKTLRGIAAQNGIPTQTKTKIAGGTDAASIQRSIEGIRVGIMSLACRYIHTSSCVASAADTENYFKLAHIIDENMEKLIGAEV